MNNSISVTEQIRAVIASELRLDPANVTDDMTIEMLGLDSLAFAEVVISLEKHFGQSIDTTAFVEDLGDHTTVRELVVMFSNALQAEVAL